MRNDILVQRLTEGKVVFVGIGSFKGWNSASVPYVQRPDPPLS